jgi:uncharacterized protein
VFSSRVKPSLWGKFRNLLWPRIGLSRTWRYTLHKMARIKVTPHKLAIGFAAGVFSAFTPFIGFHFILAALIALLVRGNVIASAIGTLLGNPATFPFIWIASYDLGAYMLGLAAKDRVELPVADNGVSFWSDGPIAALQMLWSSIEPLLMPMLLGGVPLGVLFAVACYFLVRASITQFKAKRTLARTPLEQGPAT